MCVCLFVLDDLFLHTAGVTTGKGIYFKEIFKIFQIWLIDSSHSLIANAL